MTIDNLPIKVAALYRFTPLEGLPELRAQLLELCRAEGIRGTLLLAREGINGTIAGPDPALDRVVEEIRALPGCAEIEVKWSRAPALPFRRMKVRLKREIVTMGQPAIDPLQGTGHYLDPAAWNALITDPDTLVIDTRNAYEIEAGTFAGAIDPGTRSFREFPGWFRANRAALLGNGKRKVAMFCTGGIRCEKSTAFLKAEGVEEVYHLKGGILKYLEDMPKEHSLWQGECFVFDERVTVGHGLAPGTFTMCRGCGRPVRQDQVCPDCDPGRQPPLQRGFLPP
ncbi:MAG: rhodanese-related sulfurtransferase [Novosphingobium sp.]